MNETETIVQDEVKDKPDEGESRTDLAKLMAALLSQGVEKGKLAAGLQAVAKDGAICERDLKAAMDAIDKAGESEADEEKAKAEDAFGMKFLG